MQMMHYNVGNQIVELSQLKEYFYEPGLLLKLLGLSDEKLHKIPSFTDMQLYPQVIGENPPDSSSLMIKLKNQGGGFGKVVVKVNGTELEIPRLCQATARGAGRTVAVVSLPAIDLSKALNIIPGQPNEVSIAAYSADRLLVSRNVVIKFTPPGAAIPEPPNVYAIIGGVSKYARKELNLGFSAKDACDFATAVDLGAKRLCGVDKVHLTLLATSDDPRAVAPTKENFKKAFDEVRKAKPNDILVVYLAGHGMAVTDDSPTGGVAHNYCYLTTDAYMTDLSNPELREKTSITSDELFHWMKADVVADRKKVLVLDTCAAGALTDNLSTPRSGGLGDEKKAIEGLKDRIGFHILMGCAADKVSYEATKFGQGLLTYALLEGMRGAGLRERGIDKVVDVQTLFDYATETVPKLAQGINGIQEPRIAAPENSTSFWIGRLTLDDMKAIPIANPQPIILKPMLMNVSEMVDNLELVSAVKESSTTI
jgi:Caspase domain